MDELKQLAQILQQISQQPNAPINQAPWEQLTPNNLAEWAMEDRMSQEKERQQAAELENWKHMISNWLGNPEPRAWQAYGSPEMDQYQQLLDTLQRPPQPVPLPNTAPAFWRKQ